MLAFEGKTNATEPRRWHRSPGEFLSEHFRLWHTSVWTKINTLVLILVLTVSLAANSSLLATYYFAGDDYFQFDKSIADWFATRGIVQIVGIPLAGWLVSRDVYALALIAAHAIGGYFFFLVARRGFGSVVYALFLTIAVMAFPWGYEALYWASAAAYAFASCLLWVILWALLSLRADQRQIYLCAAGLLFASFLCLLIHEAVFFSLCVAGFVVWMKPDFWRDWKSAAAVSLAPLVGALLWGVINELTKPAEAMLIAERVPILNLTHFRLRSALSPLFYQYRSLEVFDVWTNDLLRNYAISIIQTPHLILASLALCAVPFLVGAIMRAARVESVDTLRQQKTQIKPIAFLIWMVLVCEGAAFIYALAGGYSPDPRRRYIIMPMVIMSAAAAIWVIWGPQRTRTFWPRGSSVATSAICIFGCLTSLLVISISRMEMKRIYLLADLIVQNKISDSFHPNWNSGRPYDQQNALDRALEARGYQRVLLTPQSTKRATWSMEEQRWYCCSGAETVAAVFAESDSLSGQRIENLILVY
jgi:MFS family permease